MSDTYPQHRVNDRNPVEVQIQVKQGDAWEHYGYFSTPAKASDAAQRLNEPKQTPLLAGGTE